MKNILTIDVEDWYQTQDFGFSPASWRHYEDRVEVGMAILTRHLNQRGIKATFYVLGDIASRYPDMIRKLSEEGHEIGSHGMLHQLVSGQSPEAFRRDVRESKRLLEDITGKPVKHFRASSWSISTERAWALEILEEEGYETDSSMQPFKTPLSGDGKVPVMPFYPVVNGRRLKLIEVPPTVAVLGGVKVPFCGGLYFRLLPYAFVKWAMTLVNRKRIGLFYFHPWEFDAGQPRLKAGPWIGVTHYANLKQNEEKWIRLLDDFSFQTMGEAAHFLALQYGDGERSK